MVVDWVVLVMCWDISLLLELPLAPAIVAGLALALSSTAFALQLLAERGELTAKHGRAAFAILLFQDLAVIPILALLPLLSSGSESVSFLGALWETSKIALVMAAMVIGGHYLLRPIFRLVGHRPASHDRHRTGRLQ